MSIKEMGWKRTPKQRREGNGESICVACTGGKEVEKPCSYG